MRNERVFTNIPIERDHNHVAYEIDFRMLLLTALLVLRLWPKPQPYGGQYCRILGHVAESGARRLEPRLSHYPPARPNSRIAAGHWSQNANNTNLVDNRISNTDAGAIWLVGLRVRPRSGLTPKWTPSWATLFLRQAACSAQVTTWTGADQAIGTNLWERLDTPLRCRLFSTALELQSTSRHRYRPEDAAFVVCRVNSPLGNGSFGTDGTDGLGYNNSPGLTSAFVQVSSAHPRAWPQPLTTREPPSRRVPRQPFAGQRCVVQHQRQRPITGTAIRPFRLWKWEPLPSYSSISVLRTRHSDQPPPISTATGVLGNNCDASALV